MVRKFLYFMAIMIALFAAGRIALGFYPEQLTRATFTPSVKFEPQAALTQTAYADPALWLVRPGNPGRALIDWRPEGFAEEGEALDVAVFFVHPTSYLKKEHWNAPLDDADARRISEIVTKANASVFSRAAEVWAPRYRQATFGAFVSDAPEARAAHDLAYQDVAQAFDAFVAAQPKGRAIVLAGHSQGSFIIKRLLKEKIAEKPIAKRIVAAYPIGWLVDTGRDLPEMGLPGCAAPDQTGCVISFLSFTNQADTAMMRGAYERFAGKSTSTAPPHYLCSNPLTGGIGSMAPASANRGAIVPDIKMEKAKLTPQLVGAACAEDGTLRIGEGPDMGPFVLPGGNYHVYDYALYWTNLREDFARRLAAWQKAR